MEKEAAKEKAPEQDMDYDKLSNKSMKRAYKYTAFHSLMIGFGESYVSAFATFLQATNFQFSLLSSLPQFIGGLIQLLTSNVLKIFKSRKKMAVIFTVLQALIWLPILYLGYISSDNVVWYLILLVVIYFSVSLMISPIFSSWVMDIIDTEQRGNYLSRKKLIVDIVGLISFVSGGILIYYTESVFQNEILGFAILFFMAFIFNLLGIFFMLKMYEPKFDIVKPKTNIIGIFKNIRIDSQAWVIIYLSLMSFAIYIAAPFYVPYLLKSLHFNYVQFAIIIVTPILIRILFIKKLGALIDRYGPRKLLKISNVLIAIIPIMWIFSGNFWYLIGIQIYGGFVFGLYEMCVVAFLLNNSTPENRVTVLTYFNFFNGIMIVLGALFSNLILMIGPFKDVYLNAFLISTVLRLGILFVPFPKIVEPDSYSKIKYKDLAGKIVSVITPTSGGLKHSAAKDIISIRLMDKSIIKATKAEDVNKQIVKPKRKLKLKEGTAHEDVKVKKSLKREYRYRCEQCKFEFKKINKERNPECPYCKGDRTKFLGDEMDLVIEEIV